MINLLKAKVVLSFLQYIPTATTITEIQYKLPNEKEEVAKV